MTIFLIIINTIIKILLIILHKSIFLYFYNKKKLFNSLVINKINLIEV